MNELSFIGGLRTGWFNATWPFAGLTLDAVGVTVRLFGFVRLRRGYSAVAKVERIVGGLLGSPGIRIETTDGDWLVFWTFNPKAVLEAFREHGVRAKASDVRPPKVWLEP